MHIYEPISPSSQEKKEMSHWTDVLGQEVDHQTATLKPEAEEILSAVEALRVALASEKRAEKGICDLKWNTAKLYGRIWEEEEGSNQILSTDKTASDTG